MFLNVALRSLSNKPGQGLSAPTHSMKFDASVLATQYLFAFQEVKRTLQVLQIHTV